MGVAYTGYLQEQLSLRFPLLPGDARRGEAAARAAGSNVRASTVSELWRCLDPPCPRGMDFCLGRGLGACIRTYLHTYLPTYTYAYKRTYIHTYIHAYIHTYTGTYAHTHMQMKSFVDFVHVYIHVYICVGSWDARNVAPVPGFQQVSDSWCFAFTSQPTLQSCQASGKKCRQKHPDKFICITTWIPKESTEETHVYI